MCLWQDEQLLNTKKADEPGLCQLVIDTADSRYRYREVAIAIPHTRGLDYRPSQSSVRPHHLAVIIQD